VIEDTLRGAPAAKRTWTERNMIEDVSAGPGSDCGSKPRWEFPWLCWGDSNSLTPWMKLWIAGRQAHEKELHLWIRWEIKPRSIRVAATRAAALRSASSCARCFIAS
jgi:hypothetical protein